MAVRFALLYLGCRCEPRTLMGAGEHDTYAAPEAALVSGVDVMVQSRDGAAGLYGAA